MTPAAEEAHRLLRLAARDRSTFMLLARLPDAPLSAVGFHAQQAIEKALKAVSTLHGVETRRTHDLVALAQALGDTGCPIPCSLESLRLLNPFAVEVRYDDEFEPSVSREELTSTVDLVMAWAQSIQSTVIPDDDSA